MSWNYRQRMIDYRQTMIAKQAYQQAIELPTVSAKLGVCDTPTPPT